MSKQKESTVEIALDLATQTITVKTLTRGGLVLTPQQLREFAIRLIEDAGFVERKNR